MTRPSRFALGLLVVSLAAGAISVACSNGSASCPTPGGAASGTPDNHCTDPDSGVVTVTTTSQAACHPDGGATADGGVTGYGAPEYGFTGDDDDCKYHVSWNATTICENQGVVFTITATNKVDGTPLTGADTQVEGFLSPTHPAPTPFVGSTEGPPGTYTSQPMKFDQPGRWTVRMHFFEQCSDLLTSSPHGHVAFFLDVP